MSSLDLGEAFTSRLGPPLPSTHAVLLSTERPNIETHLSTRYRKAYVAPTDTFMLVVDLRGGFGRSLGLHALDRVSLDRRIRRAMADGMLPSLSVPVGVDHGRALLELVAPEWMAWSEEGPTSSVPILAVDATDTPRLAFGRIRDGSLH